MGSKRGLARGFACGTGCRAVSHTRGVTDPTLQPLQDQGRCVLGMRPLRGISDRAPLEAPAQGQEPARPAESCQPSGCVYPKRISGTPGTHRTYERALLHRIPEGVPHFIAAAQRASVSHAVSTLLMTGGWSSSTPSLSRTISEWQPKRQQHNRIVRVSINGDSFWRLEQLNTSRNLPSR
jgi:hypothetical protein